MYKSQPVQRAYLMGKDSNRKGSIGRVGILPFIPQRIGYSNPNSQQTPAPVSNLERKK